MCRSVRLYLHTRGTHTPFRDTFITYETHRELWLTLARGCNISVTSPKIHIKSRKSGKKKYARVNDVWAFSAQTRNWTNLIADADEPQIQAAAGLPACLANDSVQLAIALVVAFLVTGAALRARFRHDDAYDGPPGVQASPYVGVA